MKIYIPSGEGVSPANPQAPYIVLDRHGVVKELATEYIKVEFEDLPPSNGGGSVWHGGTTIPAAGLGNVNDWFVNITTWDIYRKITESLWDLQGNIKGGTGAVGERHTTSYSYAGITTQLIRDGNTVMWSVNGNAGNVSGTPTIPSGYRPAQSAGQFSGQAQGNTYRMVYVADTGVISVNSALTGAVNFHMTWLTADPYPA